MLTADCGNSSFGYLDICDKLLNGSASPAASAPVPTATEPTVALPPDAVSPATSPADTGGVSTQRSVYLAPYVIKYAAMVFHFTVFVCHNCTQSVMATVCTDVVMVDA